MADSITFDKQSAIRIADVVHTVEHRAPAPQQLRRNRDYFGGGFPWKRLSFGYSKANDVITVYPGAIRQHGRTIYDLVASTEVTLSGAIEWVYAQVERADPGSSVLILHSTTEPETTSTHLRIPLYKFTSTDSIKYTLERICNMGDINFDTPIV